MAGLTDLGKTRARNEDCVLVVPELGIAIVADGMGGHPGGDVASRLATEGAAAALEEDARRGPIDAQAVTRAIFAAQSAIRVEVVEQPDLAGMGTTIVIAAAHEGTLIVGHVGDSRVYRLRGGILEQLTRDDTWVQDRIDDGTIKAENARRHPFANMLSQCIGLPSEPTAHVATDDLQAGDALLLCSDGLVGMIEDEEIRTILEGLSHGVDIEDVCAGLITAANAAGGRDNITVALIVAD